VKIIFVKSSLVGVKKESKNEPTTLAQYLITIFKRQRVPTREDLISALLSLSLSLSLSLLPFQTDLHPLE
jgi:hypothetical protein